MSRTRAFVLAALITAPVLAQEGAPSPEGKEPPEVTKIREMVPRLTKKLEQIRGRTFKREVEVRYQSAEDFRAFLRTELDRQYPEERAVRDSMLLQALALVPEGFDLRQGMIDAMASQALAYYDPKQGAFFVLQTNMPPAEVEGAVLHELHHALQDQYHDLAALSAPFEAQDFANDDQGLAMRFVMEGEAFYVQMRFMLEQQAGAQGLAMMDQVIGMYGNTPRRQLERMQRMQLQMMGPDGAAQAETLDQQSKLNGYIYHSLVDPYIKGGAAMHALFKRGGWEKVDAQFATLPASTEQLLHPEKIGPDNRDDPTTIDVPDVSAQLGEGWTKIATNTFGELHLRTLFENLDGNERASAAAGWDGDRAVAYRKDGEAWAAVTWSLVFDSDADATEFSRALEASKAKGPAPLQGAEITTTGPRVLVLAGIPQDKREAVRTAITNATTPR
jgi:hypothetical protein